MMDHDVAALAKGLSEAQRRALLLLDAEWSAGPDLPEAVTAELRGLRGADLVHREFADKYDPAYTTTARAIAIRLAACWWFRLSPLGLAVRDYLRQRIP